MSRFTLDLSPNLNLAIAVLCELQGISKSQFLRMAALEYAAGFAHSHEEANRIYLLVLLKAAIEESSDKELSPKFKREFLKLLATH